MSEESPKNVEFEKYRATREKAKKKVEDKKENESKNKYIKNNVEGQGKEKMTL